METVRGCFESARRKLSSCTCPSCRCPTRQSRDRPDGDAQSSINALPTIFENERQPLVDSMRSKESDDDGQKSGCFPDFHCLRRRRRKLRSSESSTNVSDNFDTCSDTDRQLGLEESEEPRPLLRKGSSRLEYKRQVKKELHVLKEKLKYHFTNPFHKYKYHGRKPWKLILSFVKIILATAQVHNVS